MRHIVVGSSGFVGQRLVQALLEAGEPVVAFSRAPVAGGPTPEEGAGGVFVPGDIRSAEDLARLDLRPDDVVHHLAARHFGNGVPLHGRDAWFEEVNVGGTRQLLAAMRRAGTGRMVFFSTDMTYGLPERLPVTPDHPQKPLGPYGRTKLEAEALIRRAAAEDGLRATIFRPRLISGPGRLGTLATLFKLIRKGLPVPMIGSGRNRYQMISVDDCVRADLRAVAAGCPPGPFNLGSETPKTARDLLGAVIRHAGSSSVLVPTPARLVTATLALLDRFGRPLMYPEQYLSADADFVFDTRTTRTVLDWRAEDDDVDVMIAAYEAFLRL
ncbi:NAD-dependent epimerase/dehydratase family protein [Azospirillum doebereinerae]|uniref:NAD(P)-dependent oxidoreductase n=1 Tax=Azospirillum doebereinerae TaxID=92933 RepID=A0A433J6J5_9PROT|nr:NAD(P)-dependent oxidoreductase [Azospirillum doebereinerae]RUQ68817.1 NAD(P)-dependent oxidoreductase [Azospirillum doebereinerae]